MKQARVFLIGAAKCGTTTVDYMLRSHPDIFMSPIKEPNYFSTDIDVNAFSPFYKENNTTDLAEYFSKRPLELRHIDFIRRSEDYSMLYSEAEQGVRYLGESSTSYLFSSEAAVNIRNEFPDAKIIVCLREPVSRLKSHLKMAFQGGYVKSGSDVEIEKDQQKTKQGWGQSELFLELGLYGKQLSRWLKLFPKEQLHVVFFEDIKSNQEKVSQELATFLNVSIFAHDSEVRKNSGGIPKFPVLNKALKSSKWIRNVLNRIPDGIKNRLKSNWIDVQAEVQIDEDRWKKYYREDVERLERLLNLSLQHWK